jgi:mannose-1-phosphate guanylyltransferase
MAVLPSDHYVSNEAAFMAYVALALNTVRVQPELVILLGVPPDSPEVGYGWIEPADPLPVPECGTLYRVRAFWEKPSLALAHTLLTRGCWWNSFVLVARAPTLLTLIQSALPDLDQAFGPIRSTLNTPAEEEAVRALYARLPAIDFSAQVLTGHPTRLAILPVQGVRWNDLGEPQRVLALRRQLQHAST